jgi:hypothetical protein
MGTIKATNIQTITGSGTLTLGTSGETVNLGATAGGTLTNIPAFHVFESSDQTGVSDSSWTTVQMDDVLFDTDSGFASDTYTIPSGKAGKYFFYGACRILSASATNANKRSFLRLLRTRSSTDTSICQAGIDWRDNPGYNLSLKLSSILDCQAGDVYKLQGFGDVSSGTVTFANNVSQTYFGAFRIIGT